MQDRPSRMKGFSLLSIMIASALGVAVIGVAFAVYRQNTLSSDAAAAANEVATIGKRARAVYASSANLAQLSQAAALRDGVYPPTVLNHAGQPVNPWGGGIMFAGTATGFAVTFEGVSPAACPRFVAAAATGWDDVLVNGQSVMQGKRFSPVLAANDCSNAPNGQAVVQFQGALAAGGALPDLVPCVPPDSQSQTVACPSGQVSAIPPYSADGVTQTRSGFCNQAYGVPGWTPWQTVSNTCTPACLAPPPTVTPQTQWVGSAAACPSGQLGSDTWQQAQTRTETLTATCASPVGPLTPQAPTYSDWVNVGGRVNEVNTCAPQCVAPAPQTQTLGCPIGQTGAIQQQRTATCPSATGPAVWGAWVTTQSTCTSTAPPPDTGCPWPGMGSAPAWCGAVPGGWVCGAHGAQPGYSVRCS